jgi:molecular chaperone GrpE
MSTDQGEPEAPEPTEALEPIETEEAPAEEAEPEQATIADLEARLLRAQADYQNLRRRGQAEHEAGVRRTLQPLLEDLLLVLDYLDMALAAPATSDETRALAMGVGMTREKLVQALEREDVIPIDTDGEFDPALHEATGTAEADGVEPGAIVETVRTGYIWRSTVLRHAHVVVAAGDAEAAPVETEEPEQPTEVEEGAAQEPNGTPSA